MHFVTKPSDSTNWKCKTYDSILVIVDWLIKTVYYKPVKVTIDVLALVAVIIEAVVQHGISDSIISD